MSDLIFFIALFFDTIIFIFFFYERYKDVEEIELKEEKWIIISGIFFYTLSILLIRYLSFMIASGLEILIKNNYYLQKILKSING